MVDDDIACDHCRKLTSEDRDEDIGVMSPTGVTICFECAAKAVLLSYANGFRSGALENGLTELFEISAQAEQEIIDRKWQELSAKYQERLLRAREPDPTPDEGERVTINVTVTKYTKRKLEALAREASMRVSDWVRHAIWMAFEVTKATDRRDDHRDA